MPLIFAVSPYQIEDGQIAWVKTGNATFQERKDEDAYEEAERKVNSVLRAEGFVDLLKIDHVRPFGDDDNLQRVGTGLDADVHQPIPMKARPQKGGQTAGADDDKTFEIVLSNGLTIRLQVITSHRFTPLVNLLISVDF